MVENYTVQVNRDGKEIRTEVWSWYGECNKKGEKVLTNHLLYASDIVLIMNDDNKIVGGYSYVFNDGNELVVEKVS